MNAPDKYEQRGEIMTDLADLIKSQAMAMNSAHLDGYEAGKIVGYAEGFRAGVQAAADLIEHGGSKFEPGLTPRESLLQIAGIVRLLKPRLSEAA